MEPNPSSREVDEIRRQMAQIRREIHADVNVAAEHINETLNWRGYVRAQPWASVAAAAAVGFVGAWLLVPRHRIRVVSHTEDGRPRHYDRPEERIEERVEERAQRKGMFSMALGFLAPIAMRAAQNYALRFIEDRLDQSPMAGFMSEEGHHDQSHQPTPGPFD